MIVFRLWQLGNKCKTSYAIGSSGTPPSVMMPEWLIIFFIVGKWMLFTQWMKSRRGVI
jgi:hypothetical protein